MRSINIKLWHGITLGALLLASVVWAADSAITSLTELTNTNVATGDLLEIVDVSDTTDAGTGSSRKVQAGSLKTFMFQAGSATAGSWPVFGSGTVLTTAEDGALEQDADTFYLTTDAGNRGYVPSRMIIRANTTRTFTSNTSLQAIFSTPTNGTLTLETGTYLIEGLIQQTAQSATSGNSQFSIIGAGTATLGSVLMHVIGVDGASATAAAINGSTAITSSTPTSANTAGTSTVQTMQIRGTFQVTAAGTIIPSIAQFTAAAAVVSVGSYLTIERVGSTSMTSVGQWN